jgi:hypothetical protein
VKHQQREEASLLLLNRHYFYKVEESRAAVLAGIRSWMKIGSNTTAQAKHRL